MSTPCRLYSKRKSTIDLKCVVYFFFYRSVFIKIVPPELLKQKVELQEMAEVEDDIY